MNRWFVRIFLIALALTAFPFRSPAPLIFIPGEGWTYETPGTKGTWVRERAKDQLQVAQDAIDHNDYRLALKAARRVVKTWPLSDYAPQAQYLVGRSYEARGDDEKAFNAYQSVIEKYPKIENFDEILQRQFDIANRFLAGKRFKVWGLIPLFPSMDKTAKMYTKVIKNGPYSPVAPQAQMNIGAAREKQSDYPQAVKAYERAADRYNDQPKIASDAIFKAGLAYNKEAKTAEYDQSVAGQAIAMFTDFMALYPDDSRVPEAEQLITSLKSEQARGSFKTAEFYQKNKQRDGALIYYNEVLLKDPDSQLANVARQRIDALKKNGSQ